MWSGRYADISHPSSLFLSLSISFQCRKRKQMYDNTLEICKCWKHGVFFFVCIIIVVLVPPSIADEPADLLVTKHTPTIITCAASGVPFPSIYWTKNGIRLLPRGDGYRIQSSGKIEFCDCTFIDCSHYEWMASSGFFFFFWHQIERINYIYISEIRQWEFEGELGKGREKKYKNKITVTKTDLNILSMISGLFM